MQFVMHTDVFCFFFFLTGKNIFLSGNLGVILFREGPDGPTAQHMIYIKAKI